MTCPKCGAEMELTHARVAQGGGRVATYTCPKDGTVVQRKEE